MAANTKQKKQRQNFFPTQADPKFNAPLATTPLESRVKSPPQLKANTPTQKEYLRKLTQQRHDILFATGPAGTGKTYMATRIAVQQFLAGDYDKIVITRPNVSSGDDLGFLPGSLTEKMAPWTRPIVDVLNECFAVQEVQRLISLEVIEIAPLAFMRGRTFKNAIIIADEMQNATPEQMKMLLTRIGAGSRMFVTGDTEQYDRKEVGVVSGLTDIVKRLVKRQTDRAEREAEEAPLPAFITGDHGTPGWNANTTGDPSNDQFFDAVEPQRWERIGHVALGRKDVVRHPVIEEVLDLYGSEV